MSFIIRNAAVKDVNAIHALILELASFEKAESEVEVTVDDLVRDGFSSNPKFKTFVAEASDGKIIGMALIYERYSTWKGVTIHLEDLMVTENKRGIGAGKALYVAVMRYAKEIGCKRVAWEVLDWNTNAIEFYKSTGASVLNDWSNVHMREDVLKKFLEAN